MSELNIVELIENHPISKLTCTYNVKLLDKIKTNFSDTEQQLFIGSFYCYLNYDTKKDFVVDLDNVWKWMGFSQKYNTERIIEKYFKEGIDYTKHAPQIGGARLEKESLLTRSRKRTEHGGHNIKKIMMTIKCFKSLCLKAQTKKASEIHEYYMKMEEVLHEVIEEEGTELKQQMEEQKHLLDQKTEELRITPEIEKHRILMKEYGQITGSLVYIVRIKQCDHGKYIIKIGESRKGIKNRFSEFKQKYGNQVLILECFPVHDSAGFEKYLHRHSEIHPYQVKNLEGHEKEQELFMMGGELTYQRLLQIIETGMIPFNNPVVENERLKLENEQLRSTTQPLQPDQSILQEILKINQLLLQKIQNLETTVKHMDSRLNAMQTKTTTVCSQPDPHLGPRLQKIHPETLQILHVYETVTECMKEDHAMKRPSINKAVRENTVYHGFRWQLVDRELDPHAIQTLEPTKVTKVQKNGYVAKMNQEQTEIVHVYLDRKTAAQCNQYPSIASLDSAVKNHTIKDGYYYQLYEECDALLKNQFQTRHGAILLYHDGIGQYDTNHTLLTEFASKFDCTARARISQKSLAKVLDKPILYKDYYFKSLGEKLFM